LARWVFFSFHYERDIWRASQVKNSWITKPDRRAEGFYSSDWENLKKQGEEAIKRWINGQLQGTSVTVVLIGAETSTRKWVDYEIEQSRKRKNGLFGVYIHNLKDQNQKTDTKGINPFDLWYTEINGEKVYFSNLYPTYDWVNDDGYNNFADWVEKAAEKAGK